MAEKEQGSLEAVSIIAMMRAGSVDAFAEIVEHYQVPIVRYLYRLTGDYETAQDLAQETFIQAYNGILKTNSELRLKAWLYRIATNNARQYHRRRRLLSFIPFDGLRKSGASKDENQSDSTGEEMAIREALRKVPADQRACLVLHYVEGFKYREIAETLGISEDAVRKRISRGKQVFRRLYNGGEVQ
jgi:RNA polymerase sigma-70 factor (ECF subfamily)